MAKKHLHSRFDETVLTRFHEKSASFASADEYLTWLMNRAEKAQEEPVSDLDAILTLVHCLDDERFLIEKAFAESVVPWKRLVKTALLAEAKHRLTAAKSMEDLDLSDAKARQHVRGAGFARCREILDRLIAANERATSMEGKRYITRSLITDQAGVSPAMAIRFCEACAEEIAEHNTRMGFTSAREGQTHNQYRYKNPVGVSV